MSSTRHAKPGSPIRQERYASSPELERGLAGPAVARRCSLLDRAEDRQLIWALHFFTHQPGGAKSIGRKLLRRGYRPSPTDSIAAMFEPQSANDLESADDNLQEVISEFESLCLDPGKPLERFTPLVKGLREYAADWIANRTAGVVVTALGRKIEDVLEYTLASTSLTLVQGDARIGKSFGARGWCERHPGQARFVEVPTGHDDTTFYRELARGLGLGSCFGHKAIQMRERSESVLLTGDLLLCLDEASRLWPETNMRYGYPRRINWVMEMANKGVPICLIGTPQFLVRQKACEQFAGWNSAQFMGRLGHYEPLPCELAVEDLMAVAKAVLPEADKPTLRVLAAYARKSARYLAAIDAIAKRARYIAGRAGRETATTDDVRAAMQESVIPADSKLVRALQSVEKPNGRGRKPAPTPLAELPAVEFASDAETDPPASAPRLAMRNRLGEEFEPAFQTP